MQEDTMDTLHDLRLYVSKVLAGDVVQPSKPDESIELYLYEVARQKLKQKGDFVVSPGTKAFHKLTEKDAEVASAKMVNNWLKHAKSTKAVKNSGGHEEDVLMALLDYKEKR